ncbi:MAG: SOS response-associated peptidase [Candidatus Brachytrichaceae bacterium NZ_4S206]|jgi:putative SOS response-associated peptidase YedK
MCGRYTLIVDPEQLMARFHLSSADFVTTPRYNVAPTQTVAVVYDESPRTLSAARWGLIPSWAKDPSIGSRMINARAETLAEKPAFRNLLKKRRCLVLADSFYEWRKNPDGTKTPMRVMLTSGAPFALAGLWDIWKTPEGELLRTCTIITTEPNALIAPLHNRMPAILLPEQEADWLSHSHGDATFLQSLLQPFPAERMKAYPVSPRVNNVKNDDPTLIEPAIA